MKKLVVVSPFFAFMLFSLIILSACGSSDLDRNKAKAIIDNKLLSKAVVIMVPGRPGVSPLQKVAIDELVKSGFISKAMFGIKITDKGAPFLNKKIGDGDWTSLSIKCGKISSTEITGIISKDENTRIVEGYLHFEPNEVGKIVATGAIPLFAIFKRYDDGWRFVEIDFKRTGAKDAWCKELLDGFYKE